MNKENIKIIEAKEKHIDELAAMGIDLWPEEDYEELHKFMLSIINREGHAYFLATVDEKIAAFIYVSIRNDYVEGANSSPVGYVEGIYVKPEYRRKGIAKLLVEKGEEWAKSKGCKEIASDILYDNIDSYNFHSRIGFKEAGRIICFIKDIK